MNKTVLATLAGLATCVGLSQVPLMTTTLAGGVRDAAMDSKGNLFIVNGDGTAVQRISPSGQVGWARDNFLGIVNYQHLTTNASGEVVALALNSTSNVLYIRFNGWSGDDISGGMAGPASVATGVLDIVNGDNNYVLYRESNGIYLTTTSGSAPRVLVAGASDNANLTIDPTGGVIVAVRSTAPSIRKFNSSLTEQWAQALFPIGVDATSRLKVGVGPDGYVVTQLVRADGNFFVAEYDNTGLYAGGWSSVMATSPSQESMSAPFRMGSVSNYPLNTSFEMAISSGGLYFLMGSSNDSLVVPHGNEIVALGDQVRRYAFQTQNAFAVGNWTRPTNPFVVFSRPNGEMWVVEKSATNASIQRLGFGPRAVSDTFVMNEDDAPRTFNLTSNDTDVAGAGLYVNYGVLPNETFGAVSNQGSNGQFTFTPTANASGTYEFWYRVADANFEQSPWTRARVIVRAINDRPVGVTESYNVAAGQTLTVSQTNQGVLNNDTDVENTPLTAHVWRQPRAGQLTLNADGTFSYVAPSTPGVYTFQYRAKDASLFSFPVTVQINVQ